MLYEKRNSADDLLSVNTVFNLTYHAHLHKGIEFIFCTQGSIRLTVNGKEFTLTAGYGALLPPYTVHSFFTQDTSVIRTCLAGRHHFRDLTELLHNRVPQHYIFPLPVSLTPLMTACFDRNDWSVFDVKALLYKAGSLFLENNVLSPKENTDLDVAAQIILYVQENCREPLTLQNVAQHLDYNYFYVSKLIRKHLGQSFSDLLAEQRVSCAKALLEDDACSISQAALASGFGSIRNFNRTFARITGQTPRQYRLQPL